MSFNIEYNQNETQANKLYLNIHGYYNDEQKQENFKKFYSYFNMITNWLEYKVKNVYEEDTLADNYRANISIELNAFGNAEFCFFFA